MTYNSKDHHVRIPDDIYQFIKGYGKKVVRRKDSDPIMVSFGDILRAYLEDHGDEL